MRNMPSSFISVSRRIPSNLVFYAKLTKIAEDMYVVECPTQWKTIRIASYGRERVLAELVKELNDLLDKNGLPYSYNIEVYEGFKVKKI